MIAELRRKLHEEHTARSLSESTLSCISRHWAQLESALEDLQVQLGAPVGGSKSSEQGGVFAMALDAINDALSVDVTYRNNRILRIDNLLDKPFQTSDDDDDDDDEGDAKGDKAVARAEERMLSQAVAPNVEQRVAWAKTLVSSILSRIASGGKMNSDVATVLDKQKAEANLRSISEASLIMEKSLATSSQKLEEQSYLNENILRRMERFRNGDGVSAAGVKGEASGSSSSGGGGRGGSGSSSSSSTKDATAEGTSSGGDLDKASADAKREIDAQKLRIQDLTIKLETCASQNIGRLNELNASLDEKKVLAATLSRYAAGDIPHDVLTSVPSFVTLSKEHGESSQKIVAIASREAAAQSQAEELRAEQKRQSLQMNSQMQNLKIKCESQVRALMVEMGKLAKYGDELKIQLKMQQRESAKITEGEAREFELQKTIGVQRAELDRMRGSQLEKFKAGVGDEGDLKKQLTAEIEKLGEAFGKLQNQNAELVKQIKKAKQQVHDKSKDVETNRQRANLSAQNVQAIKAESERRARAEAHTSNYAKAQEAALKKSTMLVEQLRKEKAALTRELQAARGNRVRVLFVSLSLLSLCFSLEVDHFRPLSFTHLFSVFFFFVLFAFYCFLFL